MFYAACAALVAEGSSLPKSHKTLLSLFYRYFIETGKLQRGLHRDLTRMFQLRQQVDYEILAPMGLERVKEAADNAESFVAEVKKLLAPES